MKKLTVVMLAAVFAIGIFFTPSASHAVEAKVGLYMMGDWWQPGFIKFERESAAKLFGDNLKHDSEGSFMFGPMFWVQLTGAWSLGGQVLFGLSRNEFKYSSIAADLNLARAFPGGIFSAYYDVGESKCRRYDTDLTAEWAFHKYLNLLIGLRFNYDDGEGDSIRLGFAGPLLDMKKEEYSAWYFGPSIGVGFHYEFIKGLTLSTGLSAIIQFGEYNNEKKYLWSFLTMIPYEYKVGYFCIGLDMNVKLAYLIQPAHLEVFVGGRYMMLPHIAAGDDSSGLDISYKDEWINGEIEHWGGIFFGAAYKF
ncbi:MAG TPA: hypothetical protein PLC28_03690 [Spirochaetota bacterium]|nr:hypothetical protein [Spirochaetota bacterium]HPL16424.1 hypothetical protein [Spirochaetota bacterium]HQJ69785.1 hypothetical protein [Spirochaetota bacterium]HRS76427.1 hypothetical protein [Spirochaetota bacterium]HRT76355.1 hypothetical protein [Spirochaetota bacterium]